MNADKIAAGIDIGGSHITAGIIHLDNSNLEDGYTIRKRVDSKGSAEEILLSWCSVIRELWQHHGIRSCRLGFAMPGPFDYAKGIALIRGFDKFDHLYQFNIREEMMHRLQIAGDQIRFRNDAEAFLEGELYAGAAKGYQHAVGVTLGTGFGSAFSHNGKTSDAELSVTEYQGEKIEEWVSTRGIVRRYYELTGIKLKDAKAVADRCPLDTAAIEAFRIFSADFAWILKILIQSENPEVVVIGGSIANSWGLFMEAVIAHLSESFAQMPLIVRSALAENAALVGGAFCFR